MPLVKAGKWGHKKRGCVKIGTSSFAVLRGGGLEYSSNTVPAFLAMVRVRNHKLLLLFL